MVLCNLPNELILCIASHLPARDIYNLTFLSRRFSPLLSRSLRIAASRSELALPALWWAVLSNDRTFTRCVLENGEYTIVARKEEGSPLVPCGSTIMWTHVREYVFYRVPNKCDDTTLDWVMQQGTRLLLEKKRTITGHDSRLTNPYDYAIQTRHRALLKLALDVGDREQPDPQLGCMPKSLRVLARITQAVDQDLAEMALHYISDTYGPEMYQMALGMALVKTVDRYQYNEADKDPTAMAKFLLANGVDPDVGINIETRIITPNKIYDCELSCLHRAVQYSSTELVAILLASGANANIKCPQGYTPLMLVSSWGPTSAVPCAKLLLDNGAKINSRTYKGETVLMTNARNGDVALFQFLLDKGAAMNINVCDNSGKTVLHKIVLECRKTKNYWRREPRDLGEITRHEIVIRLLLENGVDTSIRDFGGMSALDLLARPNGTCGVQGSSSTERRLTAPEGRIVRMLETEASQQAGGPSKKKSYAPRLVQRLLGKKTGAV